MNKVAEFNKRQREAARPRALRAIRLREAGETWKAIGQILGVSRQRAQALAESHSGNGKNKRSGTRINE